MPNFLYRWLTFHVFLEVAGFFSIGRILGQAGGKIGKVLAAFLEGLPLIVPITDCTFKSSVCTQDKKEMKKQVCERNATMYAK